MFQVVLILVMKAILQNLQCTDATILFKKIICTCLFNLASSRYMYMYLKGGYIAKLLGNRIRFKKEIKEGLNLKN